MGIFVRIYKFNALSTNALKAVFNPLGKCAVSLSGDDAESFFVSRRA